MATFDTRALVEEMLRNVVDPELNVNIVDLGLIRRIAIKDGHVDVEMTLTTPACPVAPALVREVKQRASAVRGISSVDVRLVFTPLWTPDDMTDEARDELGIY
jgi:metal-sulfur cluster biosynthetic enzyme